jgi:uncharacterized membrane protein
MAKKRKRPPSPKPSPAAPVAPKMDVPSAGAGIPPGVLLVIRVLLVVAFLAASHLAWASLKGGLPVGCGPESGCDRVLHSRWAYWLGIPVSAPSLLFYLAMFAATVGLRPTASSAGQARAWQGLVFGAVVLLGVAVWFTALQALVIRSFCRFCLVAHACGAVSGVLLLRFAPIRRAAVGETKTDVSAGFPVRRAVRVGLAGIGAVALLVAGQLVHEPRTFVVQSIPAGSNLSPPAPLLISTLRSNGPGVGARTATSSPPVRTAPTLPSGRPARLFSFYGGRFTLDLNDVPVIGASTNPYVVVSLFDYTCHHCQIMHGRLVEAQRLFSNDLVIASLPMPLDPRCNSTVKRTPPEHTNACDYARLGLAVWRADRTKHAELDRWLFGFPKPPPMIEAQAFAARLVGAEALTRSAQDPWVEQQLQFDVKVFEAAYLAGQGSMPQTIVGTNVAVGPYSHEELLRLLGVNFGLKAQ